MINSPSRTSPKRLTEQHSPCWGGSRDNCARQNKRGGEKRFLLGVCPQCVPENHNYEPNYSTSAQHCADGAGELALALSSSCCSSLGPKVPLYINFPFPSIFGCSQHTAQPGQQNSQPLVAPVWLCPPEAPWPPQTPPGCSGHSELPQAGP